MLLIVGTVRLPPENMARALPAMRAMVTASRAEEGCLDYSYAEDVLDPGLIHITELWQDRLALDRHFASAHLVVWRAAWPEFGVGERALLLYEVGPPRAT